MTQRSKRWFKSGAPPKKRGGAGSSSNDGSSVSRASGLLGRLRDPLSERLVEALPGLDVRIVADRTLREGEEDEDRREREP